MFQGMLKILSAHLLLFFITGAMNPGATVDAASIPDRGYDAVSEASFHSPFIRHQKSKYRYTAESSDSEVPGTGRPLSFSHSYASETELSEKQGNEQHLSETAGTITVSSNSPYPTVKRFINPSDFLADPILTSLHTIVLLH